ncbi:MAG: glycerophosphoryl diester phosphodiesterase membrane domain-containing protein [Anaerolineae bacterium]|nr:glycerophosphoryl diester phosphodiesterase membrane domain-containing protein [Anaerolineae bacterium]
MNTGRPTTFTFFELLDRTFRIYRENFMTLVGLAALVTVPITLINLFLSMTALGSMSSFSTTNFSRASRGDTGLVCFAAIISLLLILMQAVLINGPITHIASEYHFGNKISIGEAFSATRHRYTNLGCGFIVFYAVVVAFTIAVGFVAAICAPGIAAMGLVFYIGVATYAFLSPVLILENVGTSLGVNRSWSLGKTRFWNVLGIIVVIGIISFVISLAFSSIAQILVINASSTSAFTTLQIINLILSTVINIFVTPLLPIGLTLLYYDTRNRVEGLDIALSALDKPNARPRDVGSPLPQSGLTQRDFINVAILIGGTLVVGLIAGAAFTSLINSLTPNFGGF